MNYDDLDLQKLLAGEGLGNEQQEPIDYNHATDSAPPMNDLVKQSLIKKYMPDRAPAQDAAPVTPSPAAPAAPGLLDKFSDANYQKAKADADERKSGLGWAQFAAGFGDAVAGRSPSESAKNFDAIRKGIDENTTGDFDKRKAAAIQDMTTKQAVDADDPNSMRSRAAVMMLNKITPGLYSPEDLKKMNYNQALDNMKAAEVKGKIDDTKATREARNDLLRDKMGIANQAKISDMDKKDALELDGHLAKGWTARSGQAGIVQGKIVNAEAAQKLIDQGKSQKGGLDSRQIEEVAQNVSKMLGGGAAASARIEALVPHTFFGKAQSLREYLSNSPQGAGAEDFVKRLEETVKREKELAENQKLQYQVEGLPARAGFKKRNPDLYNSILQSKGIDPSMIDKKGRYSQPQGQDASQFPKQVRKDGHVATVSNSEELNQASSEGWQ